MEKIVEYYNRCLPDYNLVWRTRRNLSIHMSARLYRYARLLYPLGRLLELIGVRNKAQTANIVSAIGQHETLRKGLWQYGIFTAEKAG